MAQNFLSDIKLGDDIYIRLGDATNGDLQIYHDGDHSYIQDAGTGELRLAANVFRVLNANTSETMIYAAQDGKVQLRFNESTKFETNTNGVKIVDNLGIGVNPSDVYGIYQDFNATDPNIDNKFAYFIDADFSGADNTDGDREQGGIRIDIDSTADGDANDEHRLYGVWSDVRYSGFTDIARAGYFFAENNNSTGSEQTLETVGVYASAVGDGTNANAGTNNLKGVQGQASVQNAGYVAAAYGGFFQSYLAGVRTANANNLVGVRGEVEIDSSSSITLTNARAMQAIIDIDNTTPTITNSYLLYGGYEGDTSSITNKYGLYLLGSDNINRISGKTAIGDITNPAQKLHVSAGHLRLDDTYKIEWGGSNARIDGSNASDYLRFFTSDTERLNIASDGTIKFNAYGAGYLKTDANGVISVDTSTIEDTLQSVTDRGSTTTNNITLDDNTTESPYVGYIDNSGASSSDIEYRTYSTNGNFLITRTGNGGADVILYGHATDHTSSTTTFAGNVTVGGDLIVSGDTVTLNTETIEVEDNIIVLNKTQSDGSATASTSGIAINRGGSTAQASFIFDDSDDYWDLTHNLAVAVNGKFGTVGATNNSSVKTFDGSIVTKVQSQTAGDTAGVLGTESNHVLKLVTNNTTALTFDTSQNATFAGIVDVDKNASSTSALRLKNGDTSNGANNKVQIQFGFNGTTSYSHYITSRHNSSGTDGNALDFYVGDTTQSGVYPTNATHNLTLENGRVGIGTSSPDFTLDVEADKDTWISRIYNTGSDANAQSLLIRSDATSAHDALVMGVYADSGYKMVVRSTGDVGIGTTSPQTYLQIGDYTSNNIDITTYPDVPGEHMIHLTAPETTNRYGAGISFGENTFTAANITVQDAGGNGSLHMLFGTRDTSGIVEERMRIASDGTITLNAYGAGYLKTDANGVISVDTDTIEDTLDSVTDRGATTTNAISVGGITSSGASSGRYTGLEVVNTTNAGGTETAIGLGVVTAANSACDVKLVANRVNANSGSDFYIEQTNSSGTQTETFRIAEDGDATFKGNVDIYTGAGSATLNVGRNSGERLQTYVTDTNITLTATNDADENQEHNFILDRSFGGSGENAFRVRKGGANQFTIDSGGTARLHTGGLTVDDGLINFARTGTDNLVVIQSGGSTSAASEVGVRLIYSGPGGSTEGSIKMIEQGNNSPNAKFKFTLPKDSGNGVNSTATDVLEIDQNGNATLTGDAFTPGLYVNTGGTALSGTQVAIIQDGAQNLQRWGSSTSGQNSYRFRIDQNFHFIGNSGSGDMITIESNTGNIDTSGHVSGSNLIASGHVKSQGPDGGLILRTWTGGSSYGSFSTVNMSGDEYAVLTDGTHTFISGGTGGSVHIRAGNNVANHELEISSSLATFKGNLQVNGNLNIVGNSSVVNVEDLNVEQGEITLNYNASSDTSSTADGAGIRIQDAVDASNDATMSWVAARDAFSFSHPVIVNATSQRDTSNPAMFSVQGGMSEFETTLTNNDDWQNSPISILERDNIGTGSTAGKYSPNLNFHWSGIVSRSLWMDSSGNLNYGEYDATGNPGYSNGFIRAHEMHAGVFKDKDSTGYYLDPANTGTSLNVAGGGTFAGGIAANGGISGLTLANGGISGSNYNISGVNQLSIADPGEGIVFGGGSSGSITIAAIDDANDNVLAVSGAVAEFRVAGDITATGSTVSATDGNFTSISATDITAGTYHGQSYSVDSTSGTVAIIDTVTLTASDHHAVYEVVAVGNPNAAGSGLYRDIIFGKIIVSHGYANPNVLRFIHFVRESPLPRDMNTSGTSSNLTMEVVFWDGSSESETFTSNSGTPTIRVKIDGYNSSHVGASTSVRLKRIM